MQVKEMERGRRKTREGWRQSEKVKGDGGSVRGLQAVGLMWSTLTLPPPSVTSHITEKRQEQYQCSSLRVKAQLLFQHCCRASATLLLLHQPIPYLYLTSEALFDTLGPAVEQCHYIPFIHPCVPVSFSSSLHFFPFSIVSRTVSHLIFLPSAPQCPVCTVICLIPTQPAVMQSPWDLHQCQALAHGWLLECVGVDPVS